MWLGLYYGLNNGAVCPIHINVCKEILMSEKFDESTNSYVYKPAAEEVVDMKGAGLTQTYFYSLVR